MFLQKYKFLKNTTLSLGTGAFASATEMQGDEDAEMTLLDAEDSQPSSASGFRPLEGLLGSSEGQCLRRMAYETRRKSVQSQRQ